MSLYSDATEEMRPRPREIWRLGSPPPDMLPGPVRTLTVLYEHVPAAEQPVFDIVLGSIRLR